MQVTEGGPGSQQQMRPQQADDVPRYPIRRSRQQSRSPRKLEAERLARGLGWFSLSLGLAELLAPKLVSRLAGGNGGNTGLIRLYGLREIMSGAMIFGQGTQPAFGVWSRVAGDVMDIATLAAAASSRSTSRTGLAFATANVLGVTALDVYCAQELTRAQEGNAQPDTIHMSKSVVINRSPEELYAFWHDFENFPRFMYHLESVRSTGPRTSRWIAHGPMGTQVEWNSEITADSPNELVAWRSVEGSDVDHSGIVQFERRPRGRGTIVRVELDYRTPGGAAGALVAKLFNASPEQQIHDDLNRMKQLIETGEVIRSDASPEGRGPILQEPARPPSDAPAGRSL
jgi:uncharacterized membrane protein